MAPDPSPPPVVVAPAPVQWQVNTGRAPDGQSVCQLVLMQGQLTATLLLLPADMTRLAQQMADEARQADSRLILPSVGTEQWKGGLSRGSGQDLQDRRV